MERSSHLDRAAYDGHKSGLTQASPGFSVQYHLDVRQAVIIAGMVIASAAVGFAMPLLALTLNDQGISTTMVGLNAAAPAFGILTVSSCADRVIHSFGPRVGIIFCLFLFCAPVCALPFYSGFWTWFLLRFTIGLSTGLLWIIAEAWLNCLTESSDRGRTMGLYGSLTAAGLAAGPAIVYISGTSSFLPFFAVAAIFSLACFALLLIPMDHEISVKGAGDLHFFAMMGKIPVASAAALSAGFLVTAQIVLVPLFGDSLGRSASESAIMLSAVLSGSVIFQILLGWLSDVFGRGRILIASAVSSALSSFLIIFSPSDPALLTVLFVWGGTSSVLYSLSLVLIGDSVDQGSLAVGGAALQGAYHIGNIVGPAICGLMMDRFGPEGLPITTSIIAAILTVFLLKSYIADLRAE